MVGVDVVSAGFYEPDPSVEAWRDSAEADRARGDVAAQDRQRWCATHEKRRVDCAEFHQPGGPRPLKARTKA